MATSDQSEILALISKLDIEKLTIGDIRGLKNPALRLVLADLIAGVTGVTAEHTSHGQHTDHLKNQIFERPIFESGPLVSPTAVTRNLVQSASDLSKPKP